MLDSLDRRTEELAKLNRQLQARIEEQRRVEKALRESEERFRATFNQAAVGIAHVAVDGRWLLVNEKLCDIVGYAREELLKLTFQDITHPDDLAPDLEFVRRLLAGEIPTYSMEKRYRHASGSWVWVNLTVALMRGAAGEPKYFISVLEDITSRKKGEQELRESRERLQVALQAAKMITWEADLATGQLSQSEETRELFGLPPGSLSRSLEEWLSHVHPEDRPGVLRVLEDAIRSCAPCQLEYRVIWPDGTTHWISAWGTILCDEAGKASQVRGVAMDVTERKQIEEQLRRQAEQLRSVVDHVIDGIVTIDERGTIESFNPAAEKLFGYNRSEVIGRNVKMLMPDPYHSQHDGYLSNYLRTGQAKIIGIGREVVGQRRDGSTFPMELAVSEFHIGPRRFFTGIVRDITERKRLEGELRHRLDELAETDRHKDEFLAMLSHELRNPLAPIRNAVQILGLIPSPEPTLAWSRDVIGRQVQHLTRLVDDLLDVSRITRNMIQLRKEPVALATIVARAVEAVRPLLDARKHELTVRVPSELILLEADPVRLTQVLVNLLSNAAKYTDESGLVTLTVERQGSETMLRVRDTGIGIPPELLPKVFDLFTQADRSLDRSQGGLGIGLTLVRRLVELHGGTVRAFSEGPGKGSEFVVRLPVLDAAPPVPHEDNGHREARLSPGRRILIVDDNADAAETLALLLRLNGHDVQTALDGPAAVEAARAFQPDVALLDIGLPGMDGYEVARRLRREPGLKDVRLVAVTGYGREEDRLRSREAGFDHHLTKPVEPCVLLKLLPDGPTGP
jgi:PAS domain S-box-containing protein